DGSEATADGCGDRTLERHAGLADRIEHVRRERIPAVLVHHVGTRLPDIPVELHSGRLEHAASRVGQLRAGPVAGDQDHAVRHGGRMVTSTARVTRRMTLREAATKADELAQSGAERELATLRQEWDEEVEAAA